MITISNDFLIVDISEKTCEVHSFKQVNDNYNYVWCADEKYWKGRNPILFPQVSSTDNKTTLINGKFYPMGNHGFARNCVFDVKEVKKDEVMFTLHENDETLKQYPFKFLLTVRYKLNNRKLEIYYSISNNSNQDMPFGFGLHPAFSCLNNYSNTSVIFNKEEKDFGKEITISNNLFEKYPTIIIDNPNSSKATLCSGDRKISVNYEKFKMFGIWSSGPFVCLEPWMNLTPKDHNIEMRERKGFLEIKPGETFNIDYSWEI